MDEKVKSKDPLQPAEQSGQLSDESIEMSSESAVQPTEPTSSTPPENPGLGDSFTTNQPAPQSSGGVVPIVAGVLILGLAIVAALWLFSDSERSVTGENDMFTGGEFLMDDGDPEDPVATVNGVTLTRAELNRIRQQFMQTAQMQGMNLSDPAVMADITEQSLDTLVNTELIRQAAEAAGTVVAQADVDARYEQIEMSVGGPEALQESLSQLGMTEASLRGDVEQEIAIQQYIEGSIDTSAPASDAEVQDFYDQAGGEAAGLPPLEEVRDQVEQQIQMTREQELINELLERLRVDAEIELLI